MKLYSIVTNERESRAGRKGADEFLQIELSAFGKCSGFVVLETTADTSGERVQYRIKFAARRNSIDWVILKEGHKLDAGIQIIKA